MSCFIKNGDTRTCGTMTVGGCASGLRCVQGYCRELCGQSPVCANGYCENGASCMTSPPSGTCSCGASSSAASSTASSAASSTNSAASSAQQSSTGESSSQQQSSSARSSGPAPKCNGKTATIFVGTDGLIVGGPDDGKSYIDGNGIVRGGPDDGKKRPTEDNSEFSPGGPMQFNGKTYDQTAFSLIGTSNNDIIVGMSGEDWMKGGPGNDTICGGSGDDKISGDSCNSTCPYDTEGKDACLEKCKTAQNDDTIYGEDGDDTISGGGDSIPVGKDGNDTIYGGNGNDRISAGDNLLSNGSYLYTDDDTRSQFKMQLETTGKLDAAMKKIVDDAVRDSRDENLVFGGPGNDEIFARGIKNVIHGEAGNDDIHDYGLGPSMITGDDGDDMIRGAYLYNTDIQGGNGSDSIWSYAGNDKLDGGDGNDQVIAGWGNDIITGGVGDDTLRGYFGNDTIDGGNGNDTISGGKSYDCADCTEYDQKFRDPSDTALKARVLAFIASHPDTNTITGGPGNDGITGTGFQDTMDGGDGDDSVAAGGYGKVIAHGGPGNDYVTGGNDDDMLYGDDGNDRVHGYGGSDRLEGGAGNDWLNDGQWAGLTTVPPKPYNDVLIGGAGDDQIDSLGGNDLQCGNAGKDTFLYDDRMFDMYGQNEVHSGEGTLCGDTEDDQFTCNTGTVCKIDGGKGNNTVIADDKSICQNVPITGYDCKPPVKPFTDCQTRCGDAAVPISSVSSTSSKAVVTSSVASILSSSSVRLSQGSVSSRSSIAALSSSSRVSSTLSSSVSLSIASTASTGSTGSADSAQSVTPTFIVSSRANETSQGSAGSATSLFGGECGGDECSRDITGDSQGEGDVFCRSQNKTCSGIAAFPCIVCLVTVQASSGPAVTSAVSSYAYNPSAIVPAIPILAVESSSSSSTAQVALVVDAQPEFCGNGVSENSEQCDRGTENSNMPGAVCRPDCSLARCGDTILDAPLELCDDGNARNGDGCTAQCQVERAAAPTAPATLPATIIELPVPIGQPPASYLPQQAWQLPGSVYTSSALAPGAPQPPATTDSGPAALAIMAAGASAGYAYMKRRKK